MEYGNIRPSSDLRNKYAEMSKLCKESREPIYITVNGRGDTVLLGITEYNQMISELELLRTLAEADDDVANGRVTSLRESFSSIRNTLERE
ncbi:type II toxin-antitoxin system Phd/YefM family antitoxin [Ureibacillus sp. MALMAid1270]|uniref:type II toxin-antitoxin system Phd/YefM family antitoxin n=1 Tax=Ureibacillus sp. MALMAid1270 TaxID=3411629 RepID=UPI003BA6C667